MLGSEFQREAGGGEKESSAMSTPPEEDAFFLKFLLTITAAAVAETGEAIVSCILVSEIAGSTNIHCNACYLWNEPECTIMNSILWWMQIFHVHCSACLSVADPGEFHGFHGTPLSQENTADYAARYLLSYYS